MVDGFRHKGLEEIYMTSKTRRIGANHIKKCVRILQLLEVAAQPTDMNIFGSAAEPQRIALCRQRQHRGLRFHSLQGNPKRWSVRVTRNYRITFCWSGESATEIDFEDYH
jgi:toxin HigB-1